MRFLAVFLVLIPCVLANMVHYRDVPALTLYKGEMTRSRRVSSRPQIQCESGACQKCSFETVQCINRGWDGKKAHWKCEANMLNECQFGEVKIQCEGYDAPGDEYILPGSCGLKYTVRSTKQGSEVLTEFIFIVIALIFIALILAWIFSPLPRQIHYEQQTTFDNGFTTGYLHGSLNHREVYPVYVESSDSSTKSGYGTSESL